MARNTLIADSGMMFTDGKEVTGHKIQLAEGENPNDYVQIPEAEFLDAIENQATHEDYKAALAEFGVIV